MQSEDQTFCKDRLKAKMPSRPPAENHLFLIDSFTYTHLDDLARWGIYFLCLPSPLETSAKKRENFPFPFLKVLEVTTAQKKLISLTFDT